MRFVIYYILYETNSRRVVPTDMCNLKLYLYVIRMNTSFFKNNYYTWKVKMFMSLEDNLQVCIELGL